MNEESNSLKGFWLTLALGCFLAGIFVGRQQVHGRQPEVVKVVRDTTVVVDTLVQYKPVYITKWKIRVDTVKLKSAENPEDSVAVEIPIEYKHAKYSEADVYYHGFNAGIDSLKVYPKTVYIETIKETRLPEPSRWGIGIGAGYGITAHGLSPTISVELQYNLIRLKKRK